jgi:prephenate dehydrogenase
MHTVGIIGLGLIGGSIGLALKQHRDQANTPAYTLIGYDTSPSRRQQAAQRQAVDHVCDHLSDLAQHAQILLVATPALAIRQVLADIAPYVRAETIISDTASTKAAVMNWAQELLPPGARFIGGHPMAGSTGSLEDARPDLFQRATYCLVSPAQAGTEEEEEGDEAALATLEALVAALGAQPLRIDAHTHDRCVAAISHLPFLSAVSLVESVAAAPEVDIMRQLASSGFRDASRLAAGNPAMYQSIALTNREAITFWIDAYIEHLQGVRQMLQTVESSDDGLLKLFRHAQQHRKELLG